MPRPRLLEAPRGPLILRNPKPSEGRSAQSDPKKLGTRIANLESQLDLAQEELRSLKDQFVSTESAKKTLQDQPDKKSKNHTEEKHSNEALSKGNEKSSVIITYETSNDDSNTIQTETDVFEVPVGPKLTNKPESALFNELVMRNDEINSLKADLVDKGKEVEVFRQENECMKSQLEERALKASSARAELEELKLRLDDISQELEESKMSLMEKDEKLALSEKAKVELEKEMNGLRVMSEQWRKAADAAASALAGGTEMTGQRLSERCGSMDKVYTSSFEGVGRYVGSPGLGDDVFGGDNRKSSSAGIRVLGDWWKKKGQK